MLKIDNITVKVNDKIILEDFSLDIESGSIHALMGHNGAGKSTLAKVLLRDKDYEVVSGSITYNGEDLLKLETYEVARSGIFLVSQNPIEIAGVTNAELLRTALSDRGVELNILEFNNQLKSICKKLEIPDTWIHRDINYNMSGGEKKRAELLHLWTLKPKFIILDEIDSGLDVDSLKLVANSLNEYYNEYKPSILIITHQKTILEYLKPNIVHILQDKKIKKSGSYELVNEIFTKGFGASIIDNRGKNE